MTLNHGLWPAFEANCVPCCSAICELWCLQSNEFKLIECLGNVSCGDFWVENCAIDIPLLFSRILILGVVIRTDFEDG